MMRQEEALEKTKYLVEAEEAVDEQQKGTFGGDQLEGVIVVVVAATIHS